MTEPANNLPSAPTPAAVSSGDRLSFTVFVALAIHGLLIFGVAFGYSGKPAVPPTIEVTLATHKSLEAPEQADFKAQFNQQASGTLDEKRELTTNTPAEFADTRIRDVNPVPQEQQVKASEANPLEQVQTQSESRLQVAKLEDPQELENKQAKDGADKPIPIVSTEIASLKAKLARQKQAYASRPRIQRLTSVSTMAAADAAYLEHWREKVEAVGNQNFPQQALSQKIFGQLRMETTINANGTIESVSLTQSSGHRILDQAALKIVHLAAPFDPFPPEIAKDVDQLVIIRTWRFEITGLSTN